MTSSGSRLFRFMATRPDLDDIDAILQAMEEEDGPLEPEEKRRMREEYVRQCGKLMRDPDVLRAVESGRRQSRRIQKRKTGPVAGIQGVVNRKIRKLKKAPKKMQQRAGLRIQTSIVPGLVVSATARQVSDQVLRSSSGSGGSGGGGGSRGSRGSGGIRETVVEEEELGGLGGGELDEEEGEEPRTIPHPRAASAGGKTERRRKGGKEEEEEEEEQGELGRGGESEEMDRGLDEYEKILNKIRILAYIEPWRHEQAVVEVAKQMREMNLLLPPMNAEDAGGDEEVKITWREVDKVIAMSKKRRMLRGQTESSETKSPRKRILMRPQSPSPPSSSSLLASFGSGERGGGGESEEEIHAPPANRAEVLGFVLASYMPELDLEEGLKQALVQKLQAAERSRVKGALSFIRELGPEIPAHAAAERVLEVSEMATAFRPSIQRAPPVTGLQRRYCEYNCGAMVSSIERLMKMYTCGMLLSAMIEEDDVDTATLKKTSAKFNEFAKEGLAVIDYLNQGMKVSAKKDRGLLV